MRLSVGVLREWRIVNTAGFVRSLGPNDFRENFLAGASWACQGWSGETRGTRPDEVG